MTIKVSVTAEDIANGNRCACQTCPVARAVARAVGAASVAVNRYHIQWLDGLKLFSVPTPEAASAFIKRFDCPPGVSTTGFMRSDFTPFDFELEVSP